MVYSNPRVYKSHPLDRAKHTIRVLQLQPGTGYSQISMTLQVIDVDGSDVNQFACLSYVWGKALALETVKVDNEELHVTENLLNFLRHLRHPQETLVIWVDAICINQSNIEEKADQVALMGYIYTRCSTVHIWLGAPSKPMPTSQDPFKFIRHFSEDNHYHDLPGYSRNESGSFQFQENDDFTALWDSFLLLFNSTWWTRSWTAQESILPSNSILHFGHWKETFNTLILARRRRNFHLFSSGDHCCTESKRVFPMPQRPIFDGFLSRVEWIEKFRQAHLADDILLSSWGERRIFPDYDYHPFYEIVLTFAHRHCSEPRDRVYSSLAMAESAVVRSYRPNYSMTLVETYTQAFKLMLEETGYDYRCMIGPAFGSDYPELPSWVPDFSNALPITLTATTAARIWLSSLYNASNGESRGLSYQNRAELCATGVRADTVSAVGSAMETVQMAPDRLKALLTEWSTLYTDVMGASEDASVLAAFSHVICASTIDVFDHWRRIEETELPTMEEWQQFMNGNAWALQEGYRLMVEENTRGRSLYITKSGKVGLCYPNVKPGDEVWVLLGSNVPFVLRNASDERSCATLYRFIGDCFLEKIMDGEAVRAIEERTSVLLI